MWAISYTVVPRLLLRPIAAVAPPPFNPPISCVSRRTIVHQSLSLSEREEIRSPELVAREYAELNLSDKICQEIPVEAPDWSEVYDNPRLPLMVDIGSGSGRFLLWLAERNSTSRNYLGLEIRPKLVTRAEYWADELSLRNIHFVFANANVSFEQLVSTYPGPLVLVSILCPDPHFKKKHRKRRVVQKPLVESIVEELAPNGHIFIQSDVFEVALDMRDQFDAEVDRLVHIDSIDRNTPCDEDGWLPNNPMGIRTEREIHAEFEGSRIYRRMYLKKDVKASVEQQM